MYLEFCDSQKVQEICQDGKVGKVEILLQRNNIEKFLQCSEFNLISLTEELEFTPANISVK